MRDITLEAEVRNRFQKQTRTIRKEGKVPGIFYLHGEENISITVPEKSLHPLIYTSEAHIVNLKLNNGMDKSCILRSIQFDPISDRPIHFDLQGLRENEKITVQVPVVVTGGTPVGVRDGGILQQIVHSIKIFCLPKHIPEHIEVNATELKINHFIHVRDLKIENVEIVEDEESTIVGVVPPVIEKEETAAVPAAEEGVEPEVIAKGKKPEEGAEGEGAAEKKGDAAPAAAAKAPAAKEEKKK